MRASCRLSLPPTQLLSRLSPSPDAVRSRNPSKSTLARDTVAAAVSHKHPLIIHVGAGLVQVVCKSYSRLAKELTHPQKSVVAIFRASVCMNSSKNRCAHASKKVKSLRASVTKQNLWRIRPSQKKDPSTHPWTYQTRVKTALSLLE